MVIFHQSPLITILYIPPNIMLIIYPSNQYTHDCWHHCFCPVSPPTPARHAPGTGPPPFGPATTWNRDFTNKNGGLSRTNRDLSGNTAGRNPHEHKDWQKKNYQGLHTALPYSAGSHHPWTQTQACELNHRRCKDMDGFGTAACCNLWHSQTFASHSQSLSQEPLKIGWQSWPADSESLHFQIVSKVSLRHQESSLFYAQKSISTWTMQLSQVLSILSHRHPGKIGSVVPVSFELWVQQAVSSGPAFF